MEIGIITIIIIINFFPYKIWTGKSPKTLSIRVIAKYMTNCSLTFGYKTQ